MNSDRDCASEIIQVKLYYSYIYFLLLFCNDGSPFLVHCKYKLFLLVFVTQWERLGTANTDSDSVYIKVTGVFSASVKQCW